jgi:hypothetical protein
MSDYDLKNIPILDDIIDSDEDDPAELKAMDADVVDSDTADSDSAHDETAEDNFDLFTNDETDADSSRLNETTGPEIGAIDETMINDQVIDVIDDTTQHAELSLDTPSTAAVIADEFTPEEYTPEEYVPAEEASEQKPVIESASIDYQLTDFQLIDYQTADAGIDNETQLADEQTAVLLDAIVDDVVKQLIPELEQQLRFLVKQALEDKLPAALIEQLSPKQD